MIELFIRALQVFVVLFIFGLIVDYPEQRRRKKKQSTNQQTTHKK